MVVIVWKTLDSLFFVGAVMFLGKQYCFQPVLVLHNLVNPLFVKSKMFVMDIYFFNVKFQIQDFKFPHVILQTLQCLKNNYEFYILNICYSEF